MICTLEILKKKSQIQPLILIRVVLMCVSNNKIKVYFKKVKGIIRILLRGKGSFYLKILRGWKVSNNTMIILIWITCLKNSKKDHRKKCKMWAKIGKDTNSF